MSKNKNMHIPVGSCDVYCTTWDGKTIPEDLEIEVEDNLQGHVEKGAEIEYKPTIKGWLARFRRQHCRRK